MERTCFWVQRRHLTAAHPGGRDAAQVIEMFTHLAELADAQRALDAERERVKELQGAASTPINELLAELISCAGVFDVSTDYEDDRKALETATQAVLDHVATLQAQLRQVEHDAETYRKMHTVCTMNLALANNELTTLRQLVEAFRSSEEWGAVKAWMVEGAPTWQEGVEAAKRITKAQYEMENALVGCRQALAAQDAGKEDVSHE